MFLLLEALCLILVLQTFAFVLSVWTGKNSLADVFWGGTIAIVAAWTITPLFWMAAKSQPSIILFIPSVVAGSLTIIWGLRLSCHIGLRFLKTKAEDPRYAQMSQHWSRYYLRSYLQVFLLQGVLMMAMLSPVLSATLKAPTNNFYFLGAGAFIWLLGMAFETIADAQLAKFVKTKRPGQIMQTGLWRYSRHPNYFGEVVLWWGIWLITLPSDWWYLSLIAPITITFLILKISGVPMAEARYQDNSAFQKYAAKTNAFFPWKPKS